MLSSMGLKDRLKSTSESVKDAAYKTAAVVNQPLRYRAVNRLLNKYDEQVAHGQKDAAQETLEAIKKRTGQT
jgi:hypothetical protein